MNRDPFVTEVIRIIKKHPLCLLVPHAVVLVSFQFYHAALKQVDITNKEVLGYTRGKNDSLWVANKLVALPVSWLRSYEFEIRHSIPRKSYSDEEKGMLV